MRLLRYMDTKKPVWQNWLIMAGILAFAVMFTELLFFLGLESQNLIMVYILSVLIIARYTDGYFYGTLSAIAGTFIFDFLVTEPRMGFSFTIGFPITLLIMLSVSVISCAMTTRMKIFFAQRQSTWIDAEKEKMRGVLLRAISHDLRTPLTGILSASSIIEEQAGALDPSEIQNIASDIKDNCEWLIRMVENLLAITRISDGAVKVQKTMEVVEEIMAQSVSIVRKRFPDCCIHIKAPEETLLLPMDATLMTQVLINLLENAVKYSPPQSPVHLTLYRHDSFVQFEVSDQGEGIPDPIMNHLFETYSPRQEQAVDSVSGVGIGLSICKKIVDAHGGKITGDNKPDGGSVFNVFLPLKGQKNEY